MLVSLIIKDVILNGQMAFIIFLLFPFSGEVWPGACVFPDFTRAATRAWWSKLVKDFVSNGVDGIWNDMNEPAVFKVILGPTVASCSFQNW